MRPNPQFSFKDQCSHHEETSQLIYRPNQLTGFYVMGTLVVKGLNTKKDGVLPVAIIELHAGRY